MKSLYKSDLHRNSFPPLYQFWLRKLQENPNAIMKIIYKVFNRVFQFAYSCEISYLAKIGEGLYIGHPYNITINPNAIIGKNCIIHKGVTIGQENRGKRKGTPTIHSHVWIGVNSTIVGNVVIGDDVLIAPNSYVNCDVPPHSIVFGNPCIIKHRMNATQSYINRPVGNS